MPVDRVVVEVVAEEPHGCSTQAHALESRFHSDRADVPVGLEEIVRRHDRPAVQESVGICRIGGRFFQSPEFRRQHGVDAVTRLDCTGYPEDAVAAPDAGHPCIAEHPVERVVEHLEPNERIVGDGEGVRAVPHRPSGDSGRLGDLRPITEPQHLTLVHYPVLPDRMPAHSGVVTVAGRRPFGVTRPSDNGELGVRRRPGRSTPSRWRLPSARTPASSWHGAYQRPSSPISTALVTGREAAGIGRSMWLRTARISMRQSRLGGRKRVR